MAKRIYKDPITGELIEEDVDDDSLFYDYGDGSEPDLSNIDLSDLPPMDVRLNDPKRPGYYDEITGEYIYTDGPGVLPGPLDDTSGTENFEGWNYKDGVWTDPSGKEYDLSYLNIKDKNALSRFLDYGKKLFTGQGSTKDYMQLLPLFAGLASASKSGAPTILNPGYRGGIPEFQATRTMLTAPPEGRRPGSGGINYGGDVTYVRKETPKPAVPAPTQNAADEEAMRQAMHTAQPNQGILGAAKGGLLPDGFVIPADVVSHLGNGSSEAGLELLAEELGAKPIKGDGDGMSDSIPTTIGGKQPARVANEEAFVPPEVVKRLGNGDTERGAKKLYAMMDRIRKARTGTTEQGKQINPEKFMPGGKVKRYSNGGVTSSSLAEWVGPYVTNMLGQGQALAQSPYQAYTGPLTAGVSPLQQQAFGIAAGLQTPQAISQAAQTAGGLASAFGNINYTPTTFSSQFQAPEAYKPTEFQTEMFGTEQAQQYMNPYIQQALDPQLREARRQAEISRNAEAARMSKAGAFGGSRQAIMESEGTRNLLDRVSDITGTGYSTAYDKAQQAFTQDQARRLQAQQLSEGSRQFGASQGMTAADLAARYGLAGQQATEASRQFGANLGLQGLQGALDAARAQGQLGNLQSTADINNLRALAELGGVQRGIEAEGIAADKAQFEEARVNPYKMLQFQQGLLSGLPLASQSLVMPGQSNLQQFAGGASTAAQMLSYFFPDLFKSQNPAVSTNAPKAP